MTKTRMILLLIILLAIIFRFYRLWDFQYWSVDEEIFVAVVRQIAVDHKLILLSPNVAIGTSLGSFFHLLSAPIFLLANLTASKILIAGSLLGVLTTVAVYKTGKSMFGLQVGQIAGVLYGASFLMSFSDRRWWPLSLDPLLATLSVFAVHKIVAKNYKYALLLTICASFAWHADPSLAVILVFSILSVVIFKIPLLKRQYLPAFLFFCISVLPFALFEFRHPGAISHPMLELFDKLSKSMGGHKVMFNPLPILQGFARGLAVPPSEGIEHYFMYVKTYTPPLFSPLLELLVGFFLVFPLLKRQTSPTSLTILYLYLFSFLAGIVVFTVGMGSQFHQHYFVIAWPIFFLLISFSLSKLPKVVTAIFLFLFVFLNAQTLAFSTMRYPLVYKERLVKTALKKIGNSEFALQVPSIDRRFEGFGGLFFLKNKFPSNIDYYYAWDWIYRAYSLYEIEPKHGPFSKIILIKP